MYRKRVCYNGGTQSLTAPQIIKLKMLKLDPKKNALMNENISDGLQSKEAQFSLLFIKFVIVNKKSEKQTYLKKHRLTLLA